jgi:hypothetical protein
MTTVSTPKGRSAHVPVGAASVALVAVLTVGRLVAATSVEVGGVFVVTPEKVGNMLAEVGGIELHAVTIPTSTIHLLALQTREIVTDDSPQCAGYVVGIHGLIGLL